MADHFKWLATNNAAYIGTKSSQSMLWEVLRCFSEFRVAISLFFTLIVANVCGFFVGAVFVSAQIYGFLFHIDIAEVGLTQYIERQKAKQPEAVLTELTALQDPVKWKQSNDALHMLFSWMLVLLFSCSVPGTLLLLGASVFATKHIRAAIYNFKRWYQRHAELHTKAAAIDTEWVAFGAWMHKQNIQRQSPADLFATYQRWLESKAPAKDTAPAVQ